MVVPTHRYDDLVALLASRGVVAHELAYMLVVANPDATGLVTCDESNLEVLAEARSLRSSWKSMERPTARALELEPQCEVIEKRWCAELHEQGIAAHPYIGMGALSEHEHHYGALVIEHPGQLEATMRTRGRL